MKTKRTSSNSIQLLISNILQEEEKNYSFIPKYLLISKFLLDSNEIKNIDKKEINQVFLDPKTKEPTTLYKFLLHSLEKHIVNNYIENEKTKSSTNFLSYKSNFKQKEQKAIFQNFIKSFLFLLKKGYNPIEAKTLKNKKERIVIEEEVALTAYLLSENNFSFSKKDNNRIFEISKMLKSINKQFQLEKHVNEVLKIKERNNNVSIIRTLLFLNAFNNEYMEKPNDFIDSFVLETINKDLSNVIDKYKNQELSNEQKISFSEVLKNETGSYDLNVSEVNYKKNLLSFFEKNNKLINEDIFINLMHSINLLRSIQEQNNSDAITNKASSNRIFALLKKNIESNQIKIETISKKEPRILQNILEEYNKTYLTETDEKIISTIESFIMKENHKDKIKKTRKQKTL